MPRVVLRRAGSAVALDVAPGDREPVRLWLVRARYGAAWTTDIVSGDERRIAVRPPATRGAPDEVRVSAVDRAGRESPPSVMSLASTVSAVR